MQPALLQGGGGGGDHHKYRLTKQWDYPDKKDSRAFITTQFRGVKQEKCLGNIQSLCNATYLNKADIEQLTNHM